MNARWRAPAGLHPVSARLPVEGEPALYFADAQGRIDATMTVRPVPEMRSGGFGDPRFAGSCPVHS